MKIIQIGPYPEDTSIIRGGVEASVYGLSQTQSITNEVIVLDVPRFGSEDTHMTDGHVIVYRFKNTGKHQRDAVSRAEDALIVVLNLNPSICHIHGTGYYSWAILKLLALHKIPFIVTVHGLALIEKKKAIKEHFTIKLLYQYYVQSSIEKKVLSFSNTVIVDTEYVAQAIRTYHLRKEPKMIVIPQGIDETYFDIECSPNSKLVLSVGSISKRKGHLFLIQAFEKAAEELKDIHLIICGVLTDKAYFEELKDYVSRLSCKDRISFMLNVPKEKLIELYSQAHVFALHTQEESQGIVFVEAMAAGLPVVATRVGGVSYVINDSCGYLSDYGDIVSFSKSMVLLFESADSWQSISLNCRKHAYEYSWGSISDRVYYLYQTQL
ncbi:MAG: glycosyltransferase family 4 protein [Bacteroidales bacterium]|nr:glycosyltransferase family 4 protein [Bacteroidales bacterium]